MSRLQTLGIKRDLRGLSLTGISKALRNVSNNTDILDVEKSAGNKMMIAGKRFHLIGAGGVGMSGLAALGFGQVNTNRTPSANTGEK